MMKQAADFKYVVLEKNGITDSELLPLYEQIFEFWKTTWSKVLEKSDYYMIDDFYRHDIIPVIFYKDQIVATSCYTIFDLKNPVSLEMRYFDIFPPNAMEWVRKNGGQRLMSMEYLAVHPEWRKNGAAFSYADTIINLGLQLMKSKNIGAAVGTPMTVTGVQEMAKRLSWQVLAEDLQRANFSLDILCQTSANIRPHPVPGTQSFIELLWNTHLNSSTQPIKKTIPHKKAA